MRRVSFTVFLIWAVVFFVVWYLFDLLGIKNRDIFMIYTFPVDTRTAAAFILQIAATSAYFFYFQKENMRDALLRALIFNALIYLVYILLYLRAQGV
ncbi:hypothetical protein [Persephonella sp.]|nr:hypothetical protein [Aquificota bacterium]